jgi:hypothetical protein
MVVVGAELLQPRLTLLETITKDVKIHYREIISILLKIRATVETKRPQRLFNK